MVEFTQVTEMKRVNIRITVFACIWALFPAANLLAHDFWIEPSPPHPKIGDPVQLALRVGDHFQGEPVPRIPTLIEKFIVVGPHGEKPLPGVDGRDPAGLMRIDAPGAYVFGYRSKPSSVTLDAAKFAAYLKEEGLDHLPAVRNHDPESDKPIREAFSRCAKAVLQVGDSDGASPLPVLGFDLELLPERDPCRMNSGDELTVQLLFNGQPLEGATVRAMCRDGAGNPMSSRSNAQGQATFQLDRPGFWMIKAVHLQPAPPNANTDYQSLWASLTFDLPPAAK